MGISLDEVVPHDEQIIEFLGERVDTKGCVDLYTKFGEEKKQKTVKICYLIVDADTSYNALLGRPLLNRLGVIVSMPHLTMKFPAKDGRVTRVKAH